MKISKNRIEQIEEVSKDIVEDVREVVGDAIRLTAEQIESIELILQDALTRIETLETTFVDDMHTLIDHAACQTAWTTDVFFSRLETLVPRIKIRVQGDEEQGIFEVIWDFLSGGSQIEINLEDITNQDLDNILPSRRYQKLKELLLQELQDDTLPVDDILSSYGGLQYLSNRFRCYQGELPASHKALYSRYHRLWQPVCSLGVSHRSERGTRRAVWHYRRMQSPSPSLPSRSAR